MSGGHMLEAIVGFLHETLHQQQGARGSVGSADDGGHIWMGYHTAEGELHELHILAVQQDDAPRIVARHFVADTPSEMAVQINAWLREYGRG